MASSDPLHRSNNRNRRSRGRFQYYLQFTWNEIRSSTFSFVMAWITVFIVVVITCITQVFLEAAPLVFLAQSEKEYGQFDFQIRASSAVKSSRPYVNFTYVEEKLKMMKFADYNKFSISDLMTWRSEFQQVLAFSRNCTEHIKSILGENMMIYESSWRYESSETQNRGIYGLCNDEIPTNPGSLFIIDSGKEKKMQLGRSWDFPEEKIPKGETVASAMLASSMGLKIGDLIFIGIDLQNADDPLISSLLSLGNYIGTNVSESIRNAILSPIVILPIRIAHVSLNSGGKFAGDRKKYIVMESEYFKEAILTNLDKNMMDVSLLVSSPNLQELSHHVLLNLPSELRLATYKKSNYDQVQSTLVKFSSELAYRLGISQVRIDAPVLQNLSRNKFSNLYLGMIVSIILTILSLLSIMLIYSLMVINIEARSFEIATLRMLGIYRKHLIELLVAQAMIISVPSWIIGMIVSALLTSKFLLFIIPFYVSFVLNAKAIITASFLAFGIPLISCMLPIRNILQRNLQRALDSRRSLTVAVEYVVEKQSQKKDSWFIVSLTIGLGCAIFGFMIYYLVPLSIISLNLTLFLNVFFVIFMGMLMGLLILTLNFVIPFQRAMTYLYYPRMYAKIVSKNFIAHKKRNLKTSLMYALAFGFIMFIDVTYRIQIASSAYDYKQGSGSDLVFESTNGSFPNAFIDSLNNMSFNMNFNSSFLQFSFISEPLEISISNVGRVFSDRIQVYGIPANYENVSFNEYFKYSLVQDCVNHPSRLSFSEMLYLPQAENSIAIGKTYENFLGLSSDKEIILTYEKKESTVSDSSRSNELFSVFAFVESAPGFSFSKLPNFLRQSALVSFSTYAKLGNLNSSENIPLKKVLFRLESDISDEARGRLRSEIESIAQQTSTKIFTRDVGDYLNVLNETARIMNVVFSLAMYISGFLCLFSLISSTWSNIFEQTKEIAIFRSLGLSSRGITIVYLLESFTIVLTSSLIGIIIGSILGWVLFQQQSIFTQFPLSIPLIPLRTIVSVFILSTLCAIISIWYPMRSLSKKPVSSIMKFKQQ